MKKPFYYEDILDISTNNHLTVNDIFSKLKKKYPSIWISTIYRNVEELVGKGELKKITNISKKAYFEKNKWFHIHIFDKKTWNILDIEPKNFNIDLPENFKYDEIKITIIWEFIK